MGSCRNCYDAEFKANVMRLLKESGRSAANVAKDLGINPQTLRNWLGVETKKQSSYKARIMELEAELRG